MTTYDAITDPYAPSLSPLARRMFAVIVEQTTGPRTSTYIAAWGLERVMGVNLGMCGCGGPGDAAMAELADAHLVRELPNLHCRYELTARSWQALLAQTAAAAAHFYQCRACAEDAHSCADGLRYAQALGLIGEEVPHDHP